MDYQVDNNPQDIKLLQHLQETHDCSLEGLENMVTDG